VITLPTNTKLAQLGHTKQIALKRFEHLERKFTRNKSLKGQYVAFFNENIDLGHMKPSPPI
jgi:hypothetical protein